MEALRNHAAPRWDMQLVVLGLLLCASFTDNVTSAWPPHHDHQGEADAPLSPKRARSFSYVSRIPSAKILIYPYAHGFNSHLMDYRQIAKMLTDLGHNATFLINMEDRKYVEEIDGVRMKIYTYPSAEGTLRLTDDRFREITLAQTNRSAIDFIVLLSTQQMELCEQLLKSKALMEALKEENFDLLIVDFAEVCSRAMKYYLDVPTVVYSSSGLSFDPVFFPNLPTIIPTFMTSFLDEMDFWQRTQNFIRLALLRLVANPYWFHTIDDLKRKYGYNMTSPSVEQAFADTVVFANSHWLLDFPRPLLPNIVMLGGMHIEPPKPLDKHFSDFLEGSGEYGVVLVSFGSLVAKVNPSLAEIIATSLGRLKQRIIWKHSGVKPKSLQNNTWIVDWMPQNEILAHNKTRVFVTHCGMHSTYETIHHAVPVVALPIFADQFENANRLIRRVKIGVWLDHKLIGNGDLDQAVKEVLQNPSYKENAKRASALLSDYNVHPKDNFLYTVEYVIRHGGAGHLVSRPIAQLGSAQLYGVDIVFFLCAAILAIVSILIFLLCYLLKCIGKCMGRTSGLGKAKSD